MNIQQISPDKLRVVLDLSDLDKFDLDYFSISRESPGTRRMLKEILLKAQKQMNFTTKDCKLIIEVLPGKNSGCILYLTKTPSRAAERSAKKFSAANGRCVGYILSCGSLDDTICAINRFADYPDIPLKSSALYNLNGGYHLVFMPVILGLDHDRFASLLAALSEYGDTEKSNPMREAVLAEHGSVISKTRAVESFIRYFH